MRPPVYVLYVAQASTQVHCPLTPHLRRLCSTNINSLYVQHQSLLFSLPFTFSSPTLGSASVSSRSADEKSPRMSISSVESVSSVMMLISSASGMRSLCLYRLLFIHGISQKHSLELLCRQDEAPKQTRGCQAYFWSSTPSSPFPSPRTLTFGSGITLRSQASLSLFA